MKNDPVTEDKTTMFTKGGESRIWNVSVRGWLAIIIVGTVCIDAVATSMACISTLLWSNSAAALESKHLIDVNRSTHELALITLGYYFGKADEYLSRKRHEGTP